MSGPFDDHPGGREVVLFVSSNGAGVGHLMRLMAMARRASDHVAPLFVTMSQALSVVRRLGFPVEYIPSYDQFGPARMDWHSILSRRLTEIIDTHRPTALVFDGTHPYRGLLHAMEQRPDLVSVWSRRAMWKPGIDDRVLAAAEHFDLVLEPGEFAEEVDAGATVARREQATRVGPILFLDDEELLARREAKEALGLDLGRSAVLVQLGAGNLNDITSLLGMVVQRLSQEPNIQVCLAESVISTERARELDVQRVSVYPLAKYLRAFDFAVAASGYNSFHELVAFGVPSIFVPNLQTQTDDQAARADFAEAAGMGLTMRESDRETFDRALTRMLDPSQRQAMAERARHRFPANGAGQAMAAIEAVSRRNRPTGMANKAARATSARDQPTAKGRRPDRRRHEFHRKRKQVFARLISRLEGAFARLPGPLKGPLRSVAKRAGARLRTDRGLTVVMLVLWDLEPEGTDALLELTGEKQRANASLRPVFVSFDDDFTAFRRHHALCEYVMSEAAWEQTQQPVPWSDYVSKRLGTLTANHRPRLTIALSGAMSLAVLTSTVDFLSEPG